MTPCLNCGKPVDQSSSFCPSCGTPVRTPPPPMSVVMPAMLPPPASDRGKRHGVAISFYALLLLGALAVVSVSVVVITHAPHWTGPTLMSLSCLICAGFTVARLRKLERTFRVLDVPIVWGTVVLFVLGSLTSLGGAFNKNAGKPESAGLTEKLPGQSQPVQEVKSVIVRGHEIQLGMASDDVFAILQKDDETSPVENRSDPSLPSSQIVVHHYVVGPQQISVELKRQSNDAPYTVSKIMANRAEGSSLLKTFDITTQNVGTNFQGDDIAAIATQLKAMENKDEFESTAQYQARLAAFRAKPISGATTPNDYFAFVQQDMYDGNLASWQGADVRSEYDADKHILKLHPDLGMAFDGGPIVDKSGTGLDLKDHFSDPKSSTLPMEPDQAKDLEYSLKLLFVCKLAEPWIRPGSAQHRDSSERAANVDLLNVQSVQVWIFNDITGGVLQKQTLVPLHKSRR